MSSPQTASKQSGYAPIQGLQLYYEVHGAARQGVPPLLLIHGGGSAIENNFAHRIPLFARERQIIAFDQQGHGRTADILDRPFSFAQSAADAIAVLEFLHIDQADFLGYSNGAHIALQAALTFPAKVRKLVLESAMLQREGSPQTFWDMFPQAHPSQMPPDLRAFYLRVAPHPEHFETYFYKAAERMKNFRGWSNEEIQSLRAPTLFILGDRDVALPEHAVAMYRLLRHAQLAILPDTDHSSLLHRPEIISWVDRFLNASMPE